MQRSTSTWGGRPATGPRPIYYERYMIGLQQTGPRDIPAGCPPDRIYWFFLPWTTPPARQYRYSEDTATNVYYEQMATHWGNWAKLFFQTTRASFARSTPMFCAQYPASDPSVVGLALGRPKPTNGRGKSE